MSERPLERLQVMISSRQLGAQNLAIRCAAESAVRGFQFDVRRAEVMPSMAASPVDACLAMARECDAFLLILTGAYGRAVPGADKSMVELEYEEALRSDPNKILVFVRRCRRDKRMARFVQRVRDVSSGYFHAQEFTDPVALGEQIRDALTNWLSRRVRATRPRADSDDDPAQHELTALRIWWRLRSDGWWEAVTTVRRLIRAPLVESIGHSLSMRAGKLDEFEFGRLRVLSCSSPVSAARTPERRGPYGARWRISFSPPLRQGDTVEYEGALRYRNDASLTAEALLAAEGANAFTGYYGYYGFGVTPKSLESLSAVIIVPAGYEVRDARPYASRQGSPVPGMSDKLKQRLSIRTTRTGTELSLQVSRPPRGVNIGVEYRVPSVSQVPLALRRSLGLSDESAR